MKTVRILAILLLLAFPVNSAPITDAKIKFYNFDDMLIDGKVKKPQILWIDSKQKIKFQKLLKLKKDFIPKLKGTVKDPALK